ncbi:MAG: murein L,D-transpeptidase, partial [Clostridiales bacterium]|nr:murein L,D-transpeptidase [Clostridiales bacterium]
YATRITGHILFHSVPYFTPNKDDLEYEEYNKLGTVASMGCIRLTVKDVKWIYDNCPEGTVVRMYASSKKEPLEKPIPINIDVDNEELRGWDPTDPDENNPWKDVFNSDNIDDEKDDSGQYIFSVAGNQLLLKKTNNLIYITKISKYKQESFGIRSIKPVEQAETFELYGGVLVHVKNIDDDGNVKCNLTEISELAGFSPYGEKTMFIY